MRLPKRAVQVLQLRRVLDLASIVEIPQVTPRSVEIRGSRMDLVSEVELNDVRASTFAVLAGERLLVQVPDSVKSQIVKVVVFSGYLDPGGRSTSFYEIGSIPGVTNGKYRVLQNFVKLLLTTPGTDIWNQSSGGGMRAMSVSTLGPGAEQAISGDIEMRVSQVIRQMVNSQSADPSISAAERLLSVSVDSIVYSSMDQAVRVDLTMKFHDRKSLSSSMSW